MLNLFLYPCYSFHIEKLMHDKIFSEWRRRHTALYEGNRQGWLIANDRKAASGKGMLITIARWEVSEKGRRMPMDYPAALTDRKVSPPDYR